MYRTALARSHRPRRFSEIVGQDHVAATLRAAVDATRVAHAYLFCGPRGIGKTTAARILAMALNCPEQSGGEPCGVCQSCESIWSGRTSLDVVEIDAASNRGVDDARDLRERAMYAPSDETRYKVYIVDEAHMLTREAWNALLKILEEPPPRVIFVFATTEPRKIRHNAPPVLSRVQRFDFRRVSVRELLERLRDVAELEGVTADDSALVPIARRADGGVRDALSLLDQVLSFSGDSVSLEDVHRMLGLVEDEKYLELLEFVRQGDRAAVFPFVQTLLDEGYDLAEFVRGLGDALRVLLALRLDPESGASELSDEARTQFAAAAAGFAEEDLLRMLATAADFEAMGRFRRSDQPRIQVEVLLLRLASLDSSVALREVLAAMGSGDGGGSRPDRPRVEAERPEAPQDGGARHGPRKSGHRQKTAPDQDEAAAAPMGILPTEGSGSSPEERPPGPPPDLTSPDAEPPGSIDDLDNPNPHAAWTDALSAAQGKGLGGELVGLKGATVESVDGTTVSLRVPPGLAPDLQTYLDDLRGSSILRLELARRLGLDEGRLRFRVEDSGPRRRMTAEAARDQKLRSMMDADPRLRDAVETLDLKLKE
jgi:DNA polymerase-3 subunit gamma/tau